VKKKKRSKRQKRISDRRKRFPRLYLTPKMVLTERILHHVYNRLSEQRSSRKGGGIGWYDIYKTKNGLMAPVKFMLLSQQLVERKIDPAVYLKVMSQYGMYQNANFLPHPKWLASKKALKVFKWLHRKTREKYAYESDWKKQTEVGQKKDLVDIKEAMKVSALMVKDVRKSFKLKLYEAMLFLRGEVSAWYWATFLALLKREGRRSEVLDFLWEEDYELRKEVILCTKYFLANRSVWRVAKKVLRKYL
jgi:hypothetical protein